MSAPLYGLLLSGGHSRRMQRDKATLEYAGRPQLIRATTLLEPLVERVFLSVRADQVADRSPEQTADPLRAAFPQIVDRLPNLGPMSGIDAALHAYPNVAWLVLACDLPFLDTATLQQLIAARDPHNMATAFRSSHDGKPEPLCAIFEPGSRKAVDEWIAGGHNCPRYFLAQADVSLLTLRSPQALDNINTVEEYAAAQRRFGEAPAHRTAHGKARTFRVQYFALLREQAGRSEETVTSHAADARNLYEQLRTSRGLSMPAEQLRVAVNDEFADWSHPLADGDNVVFLPPVAGG